MLFNVQYLSKMPKINKITDTLLCMCVIILPANRTCITGEIVCEVVSDIIGSCGRSTSYICKVLKGLIKYFGPINDLSAHFICRHREYIVQYNCCLHHCSDIVRVQVYTSVENSPSVGQYTECNFYYFSSLDNL